MGLEECSRNPVVCWCVRIFRWFPVLFIVGIVCWSYYAYVVELCIVTVQSIAGKVAFLIPYHILLFLFLWAYWQTSMSDIGIPPKHFRIPPTVNEQMQHMLPSGQREVLERLAKNLPVSMRTFDGAVRYCEKCRIIKPDRAHHCSICGVCVLKMDHHCPWVNACVHHRNYKYFILFLGYALLFCLYVLLTDTYYFIGIWTEGMNHQSSGKFHIMFLFFVALMFGFSVASLFFYHLWLTGKNRSTLEAFRAPVFRSGPDRDGFSLGCRSNFAEVFGDKFLLALLPIFTSHGDGTSYPLAPRVACALEAIAVTAPPISADSSNANIAQDTRQALPKIETEKTEQLFPESKRTEVDSTGANGAHRGDGVTYPVRTYASDEDGLLFHHERRPQHWSDEDESTSEYENVNGNQARIASEPVHFTSGGIRT